MKRFGFVAWLLLVSGTTPAFAGERQWVTPDFFIDTVGADFSLTPPPPAHVGVTDCRAQIARGMCVQSDRFVRGGDTMSRGCAKDAAKYIAFFEAVYDRFPPVMQKMFCSVQRISVEPGMESIAYAGMRGSGAVIGFRKSVIDEGLDLSTLLSWKEQLPFGGQRNNYDLAEHLPHESITSAAPPVEDLAFYVLAHEFGHLFDFANDLNTGCYPGANCQAEPGSWTAISWENMARPKASSDFPYRPRVCFYNCSGSFLAQETIAPLYAGLAKTSFVTLYAATNVYDDLAESLAFYMLDQVGGFTFDLDTRQGKTYDLLGKVRSKQFAEKARYLETFLQTDGIAYP